MGNDLTKQDVKNEVTATQGGFKTALQKVQTLYLQSVVAQFNDNALSFDDEQKSCVFAALNKMYEVATTNETEINAFDRSNITKVLSQVALLRLNANAIPKECGFQIRKVYKNGVEIRKEFEFFVEGSGNDKLLRTYGQDVKSLDLPWKVRIGDGFTYPSCKGREVIAPTWNPKSYSAPIEKVVYCVTLNSGREEWLISDREEVANNLKAHIMNNCRTAEDSVRDKIADQIADMKLDEMLKDKSLRTFIDKYGKEKPLISPSWTQPQSREAMIERKMMNNATKKYPKDFKSAFLKEAYEDTFEDYEQYREKPELVVNKKLEQSIDKSGEIDDEVTIEVPSKVEEATKQPVSDAKPVETGKPPIDEKFEQWKAEQIAKGTTGIKAEEIVDNRLDRKSYFPPEVDKETGEVIEDDLPI